MKLLLINQNSKIVNSILEKEYDSLINILGPKVGGFVSIYANSKEELELQIGRWNPENIVLFSEKLALDLFQHEGDFEDIAYSIRQGEFQGDKRRVLVCPEVENLDSKKFTASILRLSEIL